MRERRLGAFLLAALAAAALAAAAPVPVGAQAATASTLRVGMVPPRGSPWDRVARAWSNSLRTETSDTLELGVTAGVADDATLVRRLRGGELDVVFLSSVGLGELAPVARVLEAPGALSSHDELEAARTAVASDVTSALAGASARSLGWLDFGEARFFSTASIAAPADLRGRHVWRATGDPVVEQLLSALGAPAVVGGTASVVSGLTGGTIDTVLVSSMAVSGLSWSPHLRYVTRPSVFFIGGAAVVRAAAYDGLSAAQRAALESTAATALSTLNRTARRDEDRYYQALTTEHGYTAVDTTPNAAAWESAFDRARRALVGSHYTQAQLDRVIAAGR